MTVLGTYFKGSFDTWRNATLIYRERAERAKKHLFLTTNKIFQIYCFIH